MKKRNTGIRGRAPLRSLALAFATGLALEPRPLSAQDLPAVAREVPGDAPAAPAPVEDLLAYADLLFSREQYALAAQQYQIFIQERPESPNLQTAWFRLGECYLKVNQLEDAVTSFNFLIETFRTGPFVGSAAYRVAVLRLNERDHRNAVAYFKLAREELTDPEAKLLATFYHARSLQLSEQPREALAAFAEVLRAVPPETNPFHERALLEQARLHFELGDSAEALAAFTRLAESATTREYLEEAVVRGGLLAGEAGERELSDELLTRALRFSDTSPWKALAHVGAIFNAFAQADYERVIALYNTGAYTPPDESRARLLLVVGHSFRLQDDLESALRLYALVEGRYGDRPEGIEAGYRRLQLLHQQGDETLPEVAARFAERQSAVDPSSHFIDMAWLMVAEWHFAKAEGSASGPGSEFAVKHFGDAARAYRRVRLDKVEERFREKSLYKLAWAEIESGNLQEGILAFTEFLNEHGEGELAASALAKRAVAYQSQGDHEFALGDFEDIVRHHPEAGELEYALQQVALIHAHQRRTEPMIGAFRALLERFPETDGAGEARYWIGVGLFDLEEHAEAIPELEKARELDSAHEDPATLRLVICHYQLENIPKLALEARRYLENEPAEAAPPSPADGEPARRRRATIPQPVLEYLGRKLVDAAEYEDAEFFLSRICDPEAPERAPSSIWRLLAETRFRLSMHFEAVAAYDRYLLLVERPSERASAYLGRGIAQLCLRDFEAARASAQESLRSQKEGRTNAGARLLLGDIAATQGQHEEASREYLVVSQIFNDPEVTPLALAKAIRAFEALGNAERAAQLMAQLAEQFPDYRIPDSLDREC